MEKKTLYLAKEFLLKFKGDLVTLKGNSMQPIFKEGWSARISPLSYNLIRCGDVVAFSCRGLIIVHRIIGKFKKKDEQFFLEKGDNNLTPKTIPADSLIGKVVEVFDAHGMKVDDKKWQRYSRFFLIYATIISFIYKLLNSIKFYLIGPRRNRLTRFIYNIYWKSCFLPLRFGRL
jgi:signal peptidase I